MDQTQQHQSMHDDPMVAANQYYFDPEGNASYAMGYQPDMAAYAAPVMHPGMPRSLSATDLSQFPYRAGVPMNLLPAHQIQAAYPQQQMYNQAQAQHVGLPLVGSPPASPSLYDPLSPPVSGSDTSGGEGIYGHHSRTNSGAASPASSSRRNSLVHRNSLRYNPTPSPSTSSGRRSRGQSISDDEGMGPMGDHISSNRKEATRKQRIEAEQRRRDELRDGYSKLKDVLPVSNSKSSKVSLLERATKHIIDLERRNDEMQARLTALDAEVRRLRALNEKISLAHGIAPASPASVSMSGGAATPSGAAAASPSRPLSPPADAPPAGRQDASRSDSSGSDGDV